MKPAARLAPPLPPPGRSSAIRDGQGGRGRDTVRKVALFIRAFVRSGCQQLQPNTLNVDTLREARRHPELHRNLVVRVWGWSGYFCEFDPSYQDQIIGRHVSGA